MQYSFKHLCYFTCLMLFKFTFDMSVIEPTYLLFSFFCQIIFTNNALFSISCRGIFAYVKIALELDVSSFFKLNCGSMKKSIRL